MFIDYLTILLINQTACLAVLAVWTSFDLNTPKERRWVPLLVLSGLVALAGGAHMSLTWPLPGSFNILFGESSVLFGVLLLALAAALQWRLDLFPIALYATFAGIASLLIGIQVIQSGLTHLPLVSGAGFIWLGLIGALSMPALRVMNRGGYRALGILGFGAGALIWAVIAYKAYWGHLEPFTGWRPPTMQFPTQPPANQ